jgi:titin
MFTLRRIPRHLNRWQTVSQQLRSRWRLSLELLESRLLPSVFPVTSTADSGANTLRQAILSANANPGADAITFAIAGPGVHLIQPASPLPSLSGPVRIDGTTQPGYAGTPLIQLDGSLAGIGAKGLTINASACMILGLDITRFNNDGIFVQGNNNVIQSNYVGTDTAGTKGQGNNGYGVEISGPAKSNLVGTNGDGKNDAVERNLLSGNGHSGVRITGAGANQNVVAGNFIGTDVSGKVLIGNGRDGVSIENGAQFNLIGTNGNSVDDIGERNIIVGSRFSGVAIGFGVNTGTSFNVVAGNFIGTDVTGTVALPNGDGVALGGAGAQFNLIGTNGKDKDVAGERNIISGNLLDGVGIGNFGTAKQNVVAGNFIGTDVSGTKPLGNADAGVLVHGTTSSNTIGGTVAAARNIISANHAEGIQLTDSQTTGNLFEGNFIGTDVTGAKPLGNGIGVLVHGTTSANTIGGVVAGARNLVSGNLNHGIDISDSGTTRNLVAGNYIGTDFAGGKVVANRGNGVQIESGASNNTVGGIAPLARNLISGNHGAGLSIQSAGLNVVQGNFIGTAGNGTSALGNVLQGVILTGGANKNTIGGSGSGARNIIAFNGADGVFVELGLSDLISRDSIFSNGGLGIRLDALTHANRSLAAPVLTSAINPGTGTKVQGNYQGAASTNYVLEFFSNVAADPSGHGEGQTFLASITVTTNATGKATFSILLGPVAVGHFITSTATDPLNDTSEFSNAVKAASLTMVSGPGLDVLGVRVVDQAHTSEYPFPSASIHERQLLEPGKQVVLLDGLVRMKLTSDEDQDRVHLRNPVDVDLVWHEE